jgi:hypothetical protein
MQALRSISFAPSPRAGSHRGGGVISLDGMARYGWVVAVAVGLLCVPSRSSLSQAIDDEPVERAAPATSPATGATTGATTRAARQAFLLRLTKLPASERPPSAARSKPVKFNPKPSNITLRMKNVRADEVFAELSKQSGGAVFELSDDLWPQSIPTVKEVRVEGQPFWPALREVFQRTGTRLVERPGLRRNESVLLIGPAGGGGGGGDPLGGFAHGPLLVQPANVNRTARIDMSQPDSTERTATFSLRVVVEPRFNAVPMHSPLEFDAAEDEQGRAVVAAKPLPLFPTAREGYVAVQMPRTLEPPGIWRIPLRLALPAPDSRRIAKVKGAAAFATMTAALELEIPDVLNVAGTELRLPSGVRVLVHEPGVRGDGDVDFQIVACNDDNAVPAAVWKPYHRAFACWAMLARLESDDGTHAPPGMVGSSGSLQPPDVAQARVAFRVPRDGPQRKWRLVWTVPSEAAVVTFPYELTDLALP